MQLIIIKPNTFEFQRNTQTLTQDIVNYIEERTIEVDNMMETIVNEIGLTPELIGESEIVYEDSTHVYQLCYIDEKQKEIKQPINKIASYLFGDDIYGTAVLINSQITTSNTCAPDNVTLDQFSHILYTKFVHKGIYIDVDENNPVIEYDYHLHPLEYYTRDEKDYLNYKLIETELFGFSFGIFIEVVPGNPKINKRATRIMGKQKVFGRVIICTKTTHEFHDLDLTLFNKILKLSYGSLSNRELLPEEQKDGEKQKDSELPIVMNRYCILEKRYNNYQKKCNNCQKEITQNKLVCTGCYRAIYHDVDCQKNDWSLHKTDCLYNK